MNTDVIGKKDGFVIRLAKADDRYFFLIVAPDGEIIGENVLNEVDWNLIFIIKQKEEKIFEWRTLKTQY